MRLAFVCTILRYMYVKIAMRSSLIQPVILFFDFWNSSILRSNSGLKCLIKPCTKSREEYIKNWRKFRKLSQYYEILSKIANLNRPGGAVSQSTNRMPFDLLRQLPQQIYLGRLSVAVGESVDHFVHPMNPFATRGTLPAGLVLVKHNQTSDRLDDVRLLVHHNNGGCAKTALDRYQSVKIHNGFFAYPFRNI